MLQPHHTPAPQPAATAIACGNRDHSATTDAMLHINAAWGGGQRPAAAWPTQQPAAGGLPLSAAALLCSHRQLLHQQAAACSAAARPAQQQQQQQDAPRMLLRPSPLLLSAARAAAAVPSTPSSGASAGSSVSVQTAPPGSSSRGPGLGGGGPNRDDEQQEFAANFGEAVVVLREDLPALFTRDLRYHIYRDDVTFRTPSLRYLTGLWKYKLLVTSVRLLANLLYADAQVSLSRMWQPAANKRQLRVRWCVSGRPRLSFSVDDASLSTEVISTYSFDSRGKVVEHQVDQLIPPESTVVQLLEWLVGRLQPGAVPQPQLPIPGLRGME